MIFLLSFHNYTITLGKTIYTMRIKIFLLVTLMLSISIPLFGDENNTDTSNSQVIVISLKKDRGEIIGRRPNAPSRQVVMCTYNEGIVSMSFVMSEGECKVIFSDLDSGHSQTCYVDSSDLIIEFETIPVENFSIEVFTENGGHYYGSSTDLL